MLAIDTNIVVRYLTEDDPRQSKRARELIDGGAVFVSTTVLLETDWVLGSAYGYAPREITAALTEFAGLPTVSIEDPDLAAYALKCAVGGMDFADALHLGRAEGCEAFVTFDRDLAKSARAMGLEKVRAP
jgi:predicted nucleic-acid-binding protein